MADGPAVRRRSGDLPPYGLQAALQASAPTDKAPEPSSGIRLPRTYSTEDGRKKQIEALGFAMPEEPAPPVANHPLLANHPATPLIRAVTQHSALAQTVSGSMPGYGLATAQLLNQREDEGENDDSGKADSESFSEGDVPDDSGKADSESFSEGDGMADQTADAADAVNAADTRPAQPPPASVIPSAQAQASADPRDSLFTGVNQIHGDAVRIGDYLASGAFGQVFRGEWNGEAVALKQIDFEHARSNLPLSEDEIAEALQWEVSRLATTSHPNLVQFHGVCHKDDNTYLVLEFCDGGSLQRALEKGGIPDARLWQWMREIADALAYLHGQGMLHRDLKAENVLIDRHGRARLADLGVAQVDALLESTEAKAVDMGLQDVAFIAPENLANIQQGSLRQSSKATDIYALGLVFWQMVSGGDVPTRWEVLLQDPDATAMMKAGERMQIPESCPQPIRELILACWHLKSAARADIAEVLRLLRAMGPALHAQAAEVELLEHLEANLHAKRLQARNYVPSHVTARRIEGSIEDYWAQWEQHAALAPITTANSLTSVSTASASSSASSSSSTSTRPRSASLPDNPPQPLQATLDDFMAQADSGALLLLGEGGMGKSISIAVLADRMLRQWWRHLADPANVPRPRHLPIFIRDHLPEWSEVALGQAYVALAARCGLRTGAVQPLVFIDGYDECRLQADQPENLGKRLGLPEDAKLIVTCRPYVVKDEELGERFGCNARLLTRHILPFNFEQLLNYLHDRLAWDAATHAQYRARFLQSSQLREVLRNPFVLYLLWQSWETVSKQPLERLTRAQVYAGFIAHLVARGSGLLAPGVRTRLQGDAANLAASYAAFTERVALWAACMQRISLPQDVVDKFGLPWSRLRELAQEDATQSYEEREARLAQLDEGARKEHKRRRVLALEDFVSMKSQAALQLAATLPLRLRGDVYEYAHKSVFEYCTAQQLLKEVRKGDAGITEQVLKNLLYWMPSARQVLFFVAELLQAEEAGLQALAQTTPARAIDPDTPAVSRRMARLIAAVGKAFQEIEKYEDALMYHRKALATRESVLGAEHIDTAASCNDMGALLKRLDRQKQALPYYTRALAIREKVLGADHSDTAASCNDMGLLLLDLGQDEEALRYLTRALEIDEKIHGTYHSNTAASYTSIGTLHWDLDQPQKALPYYRKALEIDEKVLGTDDILTATSYNNMALLCDNLGQQQEALSYIARALAIREKVLGTEHTETALGYNTMGNILISLDRHQEALRYYTKALAIDEKVLGTEHTETAAIYNNMGHCLERLNRHQEALTYYIKALAIQERVPRPNQIWAASTCNNMGSLLQILGRHQEGLTHHTKALAIRKQLLGTNHLLTMESWGRIGECLEDLGRHQEALAYYTQALSIAEQLNHPNGDGYRKLIESCHGASSATAAHPQASSGAATGDASRPGQADVSGQRLGRLLPRSMQADAFDATEAGDEKADLPEGDNTQPARGSRRKCVVM